MKTRKEVLKSPGYWMAMLQMELYSQIEEFMRTHDMNKTQLAEYLGCTKGYVSQLLNGDFDHKMSKLVNLSLAIGKIPDIKFIDIDEFIEREHVQYRTTATFNSIKHSFDKNSFSYNSAA